jgi:hypothetical protein
MRTSDIFNSIWSSFNVADLYQVRRLLEQSIALDPNYTQGQLDEAHAEAAEVLRIDPKYTIDGTQRRLALFKRAPRTPSIFSTACARRDCRRDNKLRHANSWCTV